MVSDTATLDALLETADDPIVVLDTADTIVDCNEAARTLVDIGDEWAGLSVRDFFAAVPALADDIASGTLGGTTCTVTVDGTERVFELTGAHIDDAEDGSQGRVVRLDEITASRDRARELERSRDGYHALFESDQLVLWEQDFSEAMTYVEKLAADIDDFRAYLDTHPEKLGQIFDRVDVLEANRRALDFFGVESEAELEANLDRLLTEKSIRGMAEMWAALLDGKTTFRRECEARQLDTGERRHEILEINVPQSQRDDYSRVYTASIDITERKRREQELERAKERYHRILDRSSDYVLICAADGTIDYISPGVEATLGYSPDELTGMDAFELIHPSDRERVKSVFSEMLSNPDTDKETEYRIRARGGEYRWTEARGSNYLDDPLIDGVMVTIRDVTERREREDALEEAKERYQRILDRLGDYALVCSPSGTIKYASAGVNRYRGAIDRDRFDVDDDRHMLTFVHPDDRQAVRTAFEEVLDNPDAEPTVEYRVRTDGGYRWVEAQGSNHLDDPLIEGIVVSCRDITQRKHREDELERKNELLDEFARVVSHDVATPLGVIENKARLIEITEDTSHTEDIYEASDRVQSLIDDLEALAREGNQVGEMGAVELASVSRDAWGTVESHHGELVVDSSTVIDADRGRLQQLLENLLTNAVEHSDPEDAGVAINDGSGQSSRLPPESEPDRADDRGVTIRIGAFSDGFYVADDGPGIPPADREAVLEQGYTTADEGTGLGLAIVERIANGHGWTVTVTDSEAGGARFEIHTGK